jgi:uncharacterized membrane protein YjfL (UPF0719 family)
MLTFSALLIEEIAMDRSEQVAMAEALTKLLAWGTFAVLVVVAVFFVVHSIP